MGAYEEREYGVAGFRVGERRSYIKNSVFKDKIEVITDGYGKLISLTNRELLLRLKTPSDIEEIAIVEIGDNAFADSSNLVTLDISEPVEEIGEGAFRNCTSLRSLTLPMSLCEIKTSAFENCSKLESVELPRRLEALGSKAFEKCTSLRSVVFPYLEIKLGTMCFASCTSLESIRIPNTKEIPDGAFMGSSIKVVEIPRMVERIGSSAFSRCNELKAIYYDGTLSEFRAIDFGIYWNRGIPDSTQLYVRDSRGRWYNAFEEQEDTRGKELRLALDALGLDAKGLTREKITRAFREKSRRFHPDIIAPYNLDEEFSIFASEKFRELKAAHDLLIKYYK